MRKSYLLTAGIFVLFALAAGCSHKSDDLSDNTNKKENSVMYPKDPHSFANPNEAVGKHLDLTLAVDFDSCKLKGVARWKIICYGNADHITFDTKNLIIEKVTTTDDNDEIAIDYTLGKYDSILGSALTIQLPSNSTNVNIYYSTTDKAEALQWLKPEQTAGKKYPFLFTQSQAILARTWIPCQDGPGVRFTYDAHISVPPVYMAVMSAENPQQKNATGKYDLSMHIPIPSYLMSLAVGDIAFTSLGRNTGVYAEQNMLEKSAWEFADMQKMMDAAEKLYGKYAWGRYDVIVLPPSFPFGGMENPMLTFATPTIIAGDRSLVALVAHEMAHSWSGNLVTNATWDDFWLNEGFTVYFENRIMEAVYGKDYEDMLEVLGFEDLKATIAELSATPDDTKLKLNLAGRNPDDGMNDIAYEKGNLFLKTMEEAVGREKFDAFLNKWFHENAFQSRNTEEFIEFLNTNLIEPNKAQFDSIDINAWIYAPGIPDHHASVTSARFDAVDAYVKNYIATGNIDKAATTSWSTHEWLRFVQQLPADITTEKMQQLDATFHFTGIGNAEIADVWYLLSINRHYSAAYPAMEKFLCSVGRRKFLTPLYKAMVNTGQKDMAVKIYTEARPGYHAVAQGTMDDLLGMHQ